MLENYINSYKLSFPNGNFNLPDYSLNSIRQLAPTFEGKLKELIEANKELALKKQNIPIVEQQNDNIVPTITTLPSKINWETPRTDLAALITAYGKYKEKQNNLKATQEQQALDQYNKEQALKTEAERWQKQQDYLNQNRIAEDERRNQYDIEKDERRNQYSIEEEQRKQQSPLYQAQVANYNRRNSGSGGGSGQSMPDGQMKEHDKIQYAKMQAAQEKQEYNNYVDLLKFKKIIEDKKSKEVIDPKELAGALANDTDYQTVNELMVNNGYYQKMQQDKQAKQTVKEGVQSINNVINSFKNYFGGGNKPSEELSLEEIKKRRKAVQSNYTPTYNTGGGQGLGENYQ